MAKNDTIEEITNKYLNFVRKHYAPESYIVFDGYPDDETDNTSATPLSTKGVERSRRKGISTVPDFIIEVNRKVPYLQEKFLSNDKNKNGLIKKLCQVFKDHQYSCRQAPEDADLLIINTALEIVEKYKVINESTGIIQYTKTVIVVGQDIDLLVLLNQFGSSYQNIYLLKPGSGKVNDAFYLSKSFKHDDYCSLVAFLHCFTGCDTTSAFAGKGKKTTFSAVMKSSNLIELIQPFYQPNANPKVIADNGCKLIASIYKSTNQNLEDLRYNQYRTLSTKAGFKLEKLPPTVGAAVQHSYRVYFQLQTWLGNEVQPTEWGWKVTTANNKKNSQASLHRRPSHPCRVTKTNFLQLRDWLRSK